MLFVLVNLFLTRGKSTRRRNSHYSYLSRFFGTGDIEKDMETFKNTMKNAKISHMEHVPKDGNLLFNCLTNK
jgi:hypothetical protein